MFKRVRAKKKSARVLQFEIFGLALHRKSLFDMKFRAQILAQLIAKYSGVSKEFLGTVADQMAATVTEESQIEGAIAALEENKHLTVSDLSVIWQKEFDRRVTAGIENYKKGNPDPAKPDPAKPDPAKPDPAKPAEGTDAAVLAAIKELKDEITTLKAEKEGLTRKELFNAKLTEKKIPLKMAEHVTLTPDSDLDALAAALEGTYNEIKQAAITDGARGAAQRKPAGAAGSGAAGGGAASGKEKEATAEETKSVLDKIIL